MHPATVASHSSRPEHHHHGGYHHEDARPPPYNPDEYKYQLQQPSPQQLQYAPPTPQPWGPTTQYQPPPATVVINQPLQAYSTLQLTSLRGLPHHATTVTCSNCQNVVATRVDHRTNCKTHCWALCLCLFLCWPCVCIPYCKKTCMTANHYCTRCDSFIGDSHNL